MLVREVMTPGCYYCSKTSDLATVAKAMASEDIGIVPVEENDRMIGMITDRDLVIRGIAMDKDPARTAAAEVMSDKVYYCFDDQSAEEAAQSMSEKQVRRLPVVNRDKRLVGMVSLGDLASQGAPSQAGSALLGVSVD